jgi:SAM-dependent methyltransferase
MADTIHWPSFLRELDATETAWNSRPVRYPREDAVPWMPIAIPTFISLMAEAMMVAPPCMTTRSAYSDHYGQPRFLDVGCGPGTKIRLAQAMFGVQGFGIDIVPRFIAEAQAHNVRAWVADAFEFPAGNEEAREFSPVPGAMPVGYADFEIVLVNRPSALQDELEHLVMERMASDAVLICVNWRNDPGKSGWTLQYQEFGDPVMGVWIKP